MRVQFVPERTELSLQNPENLILIENSEDSVVIRAARDNFNERERIAFIRYLAAEGFISDEFESFGKSGRLNTSITWIVDGSWSKPVPGRLQRVDRFMIQLFLSASIFWLVQMAFAFFRST
jgi:hypothetical protein